MQLPLDRYAAAGGSVTELELQDCGHSPHLEHPDEFRDALVAHLGRPADLSTDAESLSMTSRIDADRPRE